jgi:hypothetical protein
MGVLQISPDSKIMILLTSADCQFCGDAFGLYLFNSCGFDYQKGGGATNGLMEKHHM